MSEPAHISEEKNTYTEMRESIRSSQGLLNGLTVDVEDYFQVEAFASRISRDDWDKFPSRVVENTHRVLELFSRNSSQGTFFVLGWVAERFPKLVRAIADAGHEVGCHSYWHRRVSTLTAEEFREDTRRAKAVIEDAGGTACIGYRAPTFSIVKSSLWALDILAEEGFVYDSSIFPVRHDTYGFPDAPRQPYVQGLGEDHSIVEVPISTVRVGSLNLPFSGGGYLRILPELYTRWALRRVHSVEQQPAILYFHPWEIDQGQPRLDGPWKSRFRHYTGLGTMESRLDSILKKFQFTSIAKLLQLGAKLDVDPVRLSSLQLRATAKA